MKYDKLLKLSEKLYALVHDTYEPKGAGESYPVVRHMFIGRDEKEAQGYFDSHKKTDKFFADCENEGKFENIDCKTETFNRTIDSSEFGKKEAKKKSTTWEKKPEGWDEKSVGKYTKTLTKDTEHPFTKCVEKIKDVKEIDDPKRFCGSIKPKMKNKKDSK